MMEPYLFSAGLGYLTGLGLHGYIMLLYGIKKAGNNCNWPRWRLRLIIGLHYVGGLGAMLLVPVVYLKEYDGPGASAVGIIFAVPALSMVIVSLFFAQYWGLHVESQEEK